MDDVTALRDALRTRIDMGANWVEEYRALDGDEERDEGYRQLDALVAAVEARAALTPERLVCARCLYARTGPATPAVTTIGGYALCDDHLGHWTVTTLATPEGER